MAVWDDVSTEPAEAARLLAIAETYAAPEQAARATEQALALLPDRPSRSGIESADGTWREMTARWPDVPAVRELDEQLVEARRALPAPRAALG
ncbi:hypothetical protein [Frankia sp. AiPa1]|uniref:hypothetical protein n=1 Tax=Frankia sp. AiPa1 TaxID=573492 RepID=UPI00202B8A42|nr:hypothetical protein [Frankia sp. AiPa1]MCL9759012.1 hypothetical protein [Frankia sp. AiPa1]